MKVRRRTSSGPRVGMILGWLKPGAWLAALSHGHEGRLFLGSFTVFLLA